MSFARVRAVARKEWQEILRDKIYFALALLLPLIMMLVFGHGMGRDVENVPLAVLDLDKSAASRDYAQHFTHSRYFTFRGEAASMHEVDSMLQRGSVRVVVIIPDKFEERLQEGYPVAVQSITDGAITLALETIRGYVEAINADAGAEITKRYLARSFAVDPRRTELLAQPIHVQTRYLFNEEVKSIWIIAPSLLMIIVMWVMPVLASLSVVREKESGSIFNIHSSTIQRAEFLLGKLIPVFCVSAIDILLLWAVAVFYFHAPFRGSIVLFTWALLAYVLGVNTLGLIASTFVRTQQSAIMVVVIVGAMVAMRYSAMFTPISELDPMSSVIAHIFPAMYFHNIVEGVYAKGSGFAELWSDFAFLSLYPLATFAIAVALFKKVSRA